MHATLGQTPSQPSLPGFEIPSDSRQVDDVEAHRGAAAAYTLFLAIFPDASEVSRVAGHARALRERHGIAGAPLLPDRLHITLHALGQFGAAQPVPLVVVDAARAAARGVASRPLPIAFDKVMSFERPQAMKPFVLLADERSAASICGLRRSLQVALRRVGLRPRASQIPHMTLAYDTCSVPQQAIDAVHWTARRYALILSHVGAGHHQWVDQWALCGPG